jgi:hypothetical protein
MECKLIQNITEESINRVKNDREGGYKEKKDLREGAKKPLPTSTNTSGKGSPMKSEMMRPGMDMETAK